MVIVGRGTHAVEVDVSFCKITSNSPRNRYDVVVERWEEAGMAKPSIVRCSKIMTINKNKIF